MLVMKDTGRMEESVKVSRTSFIFPISRIELSDKAEKKIRTIK